MKSLQNMKLNISINYSRSEVKPFCITFIRIRECDDIGTLLVSAFHNDTISHISCCVTKAGGYCHSEG